MASAIISGIVSAVLYDLDDESASSYPSGKVIQKIFSCLPGLNGYLGSEYSGNATEGIIRPEISGTSHQRILEVYVEQELIRKEIIKGSRTFGLTSFSEGDSKVTVSDSGKDLAELYKSVAQELKDLIKQSKYTDVSKSPTAAVGSDGSIPDYGPSTFDSATY